VAGINDRYHPAVLDRIERLLAAGKYEEAEDEAALHIMRYTDPVAMLAEVPAVQFALRDMTFNRGPTGAVKILQDALGLPADGIAGPKTKEALRDSEKDPEKLLGDLRAARERYERRTRDESSKFWAGLSNRWDRQHADSSLHAFLNRRRAANRPIVDAVAAGATASVRCPISGRRRARSLQAPSRRTHGISARRRARRRGRQSGR